MKNVIVVTGATGNVGHELTLRLLSAGQGVRAEIRDEGPGISAEDQKRLFGKFARLTLRDAMRHLPDDGE